MEKDSNHARRAFACGRFALWPNVPLEKRQLRLELFHQRPGGFAQTGRCSSPLRQYHGKRIHKRRWRCQWSKERKEFANRQHKLHRRSTKRKFSASRKHQEREPRLHARFHPRLLQLARVSLPALCPLDCGGDTGPRQVHIFCPVPRHPHLAPGPVGDGGAVHLSVQQQRQADLEDVRCSLRRVRPVSCTS